MATNQFNNPHNIEYGLCVSHPTNDGYDNQSNQRLFANISSTKDFVQYALKAYGLPLENLSSYTFNGRTENLLFIDSHAVVVRIGFENITPRICPGVLQPLHFIEDPDSGLTISIYPGIDAVIEFQDTANLRRLLDRYNGPNEDTGSENCGYIYTNDAYVPHIFDPSETHYYDSFYIPEFLSPYQRLTEAFSAYTNETNKDELAPYNNGFEFHQPIRRAFHQAFKTVKMGEMPNQKALEKAWKMLKTYKEKGYKIFKNGQEDSVRYNYAAWSIEYAIQTQTIKNLTRVPFEQRTPEVCTAAIKTNPYSLPYIPEEHRSEQICKIALRHDTRLISHVPESVKTREFLYELFEENPQNISMMPAKWVTNDMIQTYFKTHFSLGNIPEEKRSWYVCARSILLYPDNITHVPQELKNIDKLYALAIRKKPALFMFVPQEHKTDLVLEAFCKNADKTTARFFGGKDVPDRFVPMVFDNNPTLLGVLKDRAHLIPEDMIVKHLQNDNLSGYDVLNVDTLSSKVIFCAIEHTPHILSHLPERLQTSEFIIEFCNHVTDPAPYIKRINKLYPDNTAILQAINNHAGMKKRNKKQLALRY